MNTALHNCVRIAGLVQARGAESEGFFNRSHRGAVAEP